jgi:hypothetical protein
MATVLSAAQVVALAELYKNEDQLGRGHPDLLDQALDLTLSERRQDQSGSYLYRNVLRNARFQYCDAHGTESRRLRAIHLPTHPTGARFGATRGDGNRSTSWTTAHQNPPPLRPTSSHTSAAWSNSSASTGCNAWTASLLD